ncbi:MAG: methyltransferase [Candidatus Paceibacterota bacterium]
MENSDKNRIHGVHHVLAHSYTMHLSLFLVGVVLDLIFHFKLFNHPSAAPIGIFFLIFGTFLIIWAQKTSRKLNKNNINKESFLRGPYRYTRTPTNFGLCFLVLGFGLIINAFFVILSAFVSFLISKFVFLNKQEKMLAAKYGAPYLEYKKMVKF